MDTFDNLENQGIAPSEIMKAAEVFAAITKVREQAFKLRPKQVTANRACRQIRTEIDLLEYGTASIALRSSGDPQDAAQAELIERFCMLNHANKDEAAVFFKRYVHDAGAQRPIDHLSNLCGLTNKINPKPFGRS